MVGCDVKIRVKIRLPALIAGSRRVPTEVGLLLLLRRLYRASSFVLPTDVGLMFRVASIGVPAIALVPAKFVTRPAVGGAAPLGVLF